VPPETSTKPQEPLLPAGAAGNKHETSGTTGAGGNTSGVTGAAGSPAEAGQSPPEDFFILKNNCFLRFNKLNRALVALVAIKIICHG
jgi:hypothetical protein